MAKKARSKSSLKGKAKRKRAVSLPPPDDALLRHEELNIDRTIAGERLTALPKGGRRKLKISRQKVQPSSSVRMAQFRLQAIEHTRRMSHLKAAAESTAEPVAPTPGAS